MERERDSKRKPTRQEAIPPANAAVDENVFGVGHHDDVQGRVWDGRVDPRQSQGGVKNGDEAHDVEVEMVTVALDHLVALCVHEHAGDVLVDEE